MMTVTEKQRQQQAELHKKLWSIANDLRGNMDASEFRNYILGLIFYRFLSEKTEAEIDDMLSEDNISYSEAWQDDEMQEALKDELTTRIGYVVEPRYLFSTMIREIEAGTSTSRSCPKPSRPSRHRRLENRVRTTSPISSMIWTLHPHASATASPPGRNSSPKSC